MKTVSPSPVQTADIKGDITLPHELKPMNRSIRVKDDSKMSLRPLQALSGERCLHQLKTRCIRQDPNRKEATHWKGDISERLMEGLQKFEQGSRSQQGGELATEGSYPHTWKGKGKGWLWKLLSIPPRRSAADARHRQTQLPDSERSGQWTRRAKEKKSSGLNFALALKIKSILLNKIP